MRMIRQDRSARCARLFLAVGHPTERLRYQFCMKPTCPRKVEAAATAPSATFRPSAGSGSGAGPTITSAAFLGLKTEPWQEQTNASRSLDHMLTGQPW